MKNYARAQRPVKHYLSGKINQIQNQASEFIEINKFIKTYTPGKFFCGRPSQVSKFLQIIYSLR